MGTSYSIQSNESYASERGWVTRRENKKRMALADKIVLAVIDQISTDIIRPGPTPEERECYVMAQELRDHSVQLKEIVAAILKIEEEE